MLLTSDEFIKKLKSIANADDAKQLSRYFKTGEGQYGAGDTFIGVRMGAVFKLAKESIDMPLNEIEILLQSDIHEARAGAVAIMDWQARRKKTPEDQRKKLFDLYIKRHKFINNWDLVDRSAMYVVGGYLNVKPRDILYKLARSKNMWERRTSIISTFYFIRQNDFDDSLKIAEILLGDKEDLIHKATGWALRTIGDKNQNILNKFLDKHAATMPRTALRYSLEKFDKETKLHYMGLKSKAKV